MAFASYYWRFYASLNQIAIQIVWFWLGGQSSSLLPEINREIFSIAAARLFLSAPNCF
jgi:hypothetical protein